jgi:hypothetical protein
MAADSDDGSSTAELAQRAQKKQGHDNDQGLSYQEGIIHAPATGRVAFTVPGMADYVSMLNEEYAPAAAPRR